MKKAEASERTRQMIIDAFWTLFEKKSIRKISIRDITDLAGVHRNTFYRYFESTYDLIDKIEAQIADQFCRWTNENMIGDKREAVKAMFMSILKNEDRYFRLLIRKNDETRFSEKLGKMMFDHLKEQFVFSDNEEFNDFIIEYIQAGSIAAIVRFFNHQNSITAGELCDIDMKLVFTDAYALVSVK